MAQVVGLVALPMCLILFRSLPDRGYALSKPFALLLVGYLFWILNIIGILSNSAGAIRLVLLLLAVGSAYLLWRRRDELVAFVREHWWLIAATEVIFFLALITAAYLRSYVPEITGTEKPMDFMLLNAVTRGEGFPPADPWLAGESVSYYYFGYLLVSIMTRLSGLETAIGFNLGLAMIVALGVTGAFGLVYNLAAPREKRQPTSTTAPSGFSTSPLWRPMAFGLVAGLLLAVMGNLEGALEWFAARDLGGDGLWSWIGVNNLSAYDSTRWFPDQFWFWWRATRILDLGRGIHEFPFFSFLLGDLHPHVMSIPFVLLAVGAALSLLRSEGPLDFVSWLERPLSLVALGLILGALAFLNTWDMPTMAFVVVLIALLRNRMHADRWSWGLALDTLGFVVPLFVVAALAYSPFFFGGFSSQASGFTAEAGAGSGLFHTFLIWGPFAVLVLPYAYWRLASNERPVTPAALLWSLTPAVALVTLWVLWDPLASALGWLPAIIQPNEAAAGLGTRIGERGWNWLTVLVLAGALSLLLLALAREVESSKRSDDERLGHVFALALAATAALLILGSEFIYIQDGFSSRMNTIFKLYYQAWLLLSIAGGFALYELARGWRPPQIAWRAVWTGGVAVVLLAAFIYPLTATYNRTEGFAVRRTLDGLAYLPPDERAAIEWLADRPGQPVIAEALGGDYSAGGRVSASTGLPTLLQWPGHELQWRGTSEPQAGRAEDLDRLYTSIDSNEVRSIIRKYGITYVYSGSFERQQYPALSLDRMPDIFEPVFQQGDVTIYRAKVGILSELTRE